VRVTARLDAGDHVEPRAHVFIIRDANAETGPAGNRARPTRMLSILSSLAMLPCAMWIDRLRKLCVDNNLIVSALIRAGGRHRLTITDVTGRAIIRSLSS